MKPINIIKILGIIGLLFLLPSISNAQIQRVWNIAEYTSTMLPPPSGGTKVAYRTLNNSLYYWNGTIWKRIAGPGIVDTNYTVSMLGSTISLNGSGTSVDIAPYVSTNPTTIANTQVAVSNGSTLVGYANYTYTETAPLRTLRVGATYIQDDNNGRYIEAANGIFIRGTTNTNNLIRVDAINQLAILTGINGVNVRNTATLNTAVFTAISGPPSYSIMEFGKQRNDGVKYGVIRTIDEAFGGSGSPINLQIYPGKNTTTAEQANTFLAYDGTSKRGNVSIGGSSSSYTLDITATDAIRLPRGTDAQRPTNAFGLLRGNTTGTGLEWHNGTRWAYALESTFARGTATRIPFFDANGQVTESANLTYTGTRFQTGGSIRIGFNNATNDTASIEKVIDVNSKIIRINNPGSSGGYQAGLVFRGGSNGLLATVNTFRIYTNSATVPGSVYIGNVTESGANTGNPTTNLGVLNKITSTNVYDTGVNLNPNGLSPNNFSAYSLTNGKHFGLFIGGQGGTNQLQSMSDIGYGVFAGFQYQPLTNGYGSSWVFVAKNDAATATEVLRLQGKDGNICLGCTNAQYQLYTTNTGAYGIPRGTVAQRPTIVASTTPLRYNTDSTALEYGESVGTWRQIATRAYARSLVAGLSTGTVTSVGLSLPSIFSVSGSPVTTSGTLSASFTGGNTRQVLRGDGIWANTLDSFRINQSLASVERFEVNGNIVLNRNSGSNKLILTRNWSQEIFGGGVTGDMTYRNGSGPGFQNYFILGTVSGVDTMVTMNYNGIGISVGKWNKIQARLHVKGIGTTTGKTMLLEDSGGADILTITDNKTIQAHGYGAGTKEAADLSKTQSNYIAGFATDGTVLDLGLGSGLSVSGGLLTSANIGNSNLTLTGNRTLSGAFTLDLDPTTVRLYGKYNLPDETPDLNKSTAIGFFNGAPAMIQLARDTFIEDVTLFSVGTLLNTCQELTIVSSMTALAPTNMEIRFPDASDVYRGRKIIVYSKKKDAGAFIPQIKVVGGASRLYFTTNPAVGGTDPSDQSTLSIDDSTWSDHGTSFEFTCLRIDNTPSYRWVLKQR